MLCVLRDYTVDHRVKKSLGKKITTLIELLPLKSLNFKEKNNLYNIYSES